MAGYLFPFPLALFLVCLVSVYHLVFIMINNVLSLIFNVMIQRYQVDQLFIIVDINIFPNSKEFL